MLSRKLELYEIICSSSNINFLLEFEASNLKKEYFIKSFKLVAKNHPYYRTKLVNIDGSLQFFEKSLEEQDQIFVEQIYLTSTEQFKDWQARLVKIGSQPRDCSKSLAYFEIYSYENRHQLFGNINHSGIDGPGVFTTIKDLCFYLDSILSDSVENDIKSRIFHNIHGNYDIFDLDSLKKEKLIDNTIEGLKPLSLLSDDSSINPIIESVFHQLNENLTKSLIENCKKNKPTIQGVLSTALALSLLKDKLDNLSDEPIRLVNSCPCNMRDMLKPKLEKEDIVCGSAALIWLDEINASSVLWDLALNTTNSIKKARDDNYGYKWWIKLKNSIPFQQYSIMGSSMGVVTLNENELKNLKIIDLRFLGSAYSLPKNSASCMTHAFTFLNKFTFNLSYTYPGLSKLWADNFSNNILVILEYFAKNDCADQTTVSGIWEKMGKFIRN
jgi:hypothetical protein